MKKTRILAVVLSLCMLLALVPVAALAAEFTDADEVSNASFADAIDRWADEGVISGNPDGSFDPKGTMSRVQGFGIIAELLNLTEKADLSEYTDVPTDGWKADYLAKVVAAGIVTGYPDKTLRPEGELTREQMFVTIAKTLGIQPVETDDEEFEDIGEATSYAAPYINALHKMGAVNGSNGNVNPLDTLSREGAALLLDNLIGGYANEDGETATIEEGKITLVVADNVKVEGTANDQPIVVAGQAATVDMDGVEGTPTVNVTVPEVKIENAPVGTTVTVAEDVTDVTVNDETVEAGGEVVVEEPTPTPPTTYPTQPQQPQTETEETYTVYFDATHGGISVQSIEKFGETCPGGENTCYGGENTCYGGENEDGGKHAEWFSIEVTAKPSELTLTKIGFDDDGEFGSFVLNPSSFDPWKDYVFAGWYLRNASVKADSVNASDYVAVKGFIGNLKDYATDDGKLVFYAAWQKKDEEGSTCFGGSNADNGVYGPDSHNDPTPTQAYTIIFDPTNGTMGLNTFVDRNGVCYGGENTCWGGENTCYGGENADAANWCYFKVTTTGSLKLSDIPVLLNDTKSGNGTFTLTPKDGWEGYTFAGWYVTKSKDSTSASDYVSAATLTDDTLSQYIDEGHVIVFYAAWEKAGVGGSTCFGGQNSDNGNYGGTTANDPTPNNG